MAINIQYRIKMERLTLNVERQMKSIERSRTYYSPRGRGRNWHGVLNNSIIFRYINGNFIFKSLYYGQFQDEGIRRGRKTTEISRRIWPQGGNNRTSNGFKGLHWTQPMAKVNAPAILKEITPLMHVYMKNEIVKSVKIKL